ncbi:MAG: acyloxyacyl hydrolase [Cyanobacteria bacterium J06576_12]
MAIVPAALATESTVSKEAILGSKEEVILEESVLGENTLEESVLEEEIASVGLMSEFFPEESTAEESVLAQIVIEESAFEEESVLAQIVIEESAFEEESVLEESILEEINPEGAVIESVVIEEIAAEEIATGEAAEFFFEETALDQLNVASVGLFETDSNPLQTVGLTSPEASQLVSQAAPQPNPQPTPQPLWLSQTAEAEDAPPPFGTAGKQRWYLQSGVGLDFDDDAFGLVGAGVTHFVYDYHSINLELNGLYFDQPGDNAAGLNLTFLLRSHWIRGDNWTIYVDGGVGVLQSTDGVPSVGSTFNFTPQIGGGATFALNDAQRLMVGMRWHHTSSANTFRPNPGLDVVLGYVGINFPL